MKNHVCYCYGYYLAFVPVTGRAEKFFSTTLTMKSEILKGESKFAVYLRLIMTPQ